MTITLKGLRAMKTLLESKSKGHKEEKYVRSVHNEEYTLLQVTTADAVVTMKMNNKRYYLPVAPDRFHDCYVIDGLKFIEHHLSQFGILQAQPYPGPGAAGGPAELGLRIQNKAYLCTEVGITPPIFDEDDQVFAEPDGKKFRDNLFWVAKAAARKDVRYYLNSVCLTGSRMAASDGARLHIVDGEFPAPAESKTILPIKGVKLLLDVMGSDFKGTVRTEFGSDIVRVTALDDCGVSISVDMRKVSGSFPDVNRVIPNSGWYGSVGGPSSAVRKAIRELPKDLPASERYIAAQVSIKLSDPAVMVLTTHPIDQEPVRVLRTAEGMETSYKVVELNRESGVFDRKKLADLVSVPCDDQSMDLFDYIVGVHNTQKVKMSGIDGDYAYTGVLMT